ncbi:MAG: Crp/Fnr family transcriptional regulator [Devosia sp.]|nr:Crp/Fnr family transcriptional regulator [Devosia sp.]
MSDEMALTHEFLALMLGVRRPNVINALHLLEGQGFICAERGYITIRSRKRLERFTGHSYGLAEKVYAGLIQPGKGRRNTEKHPQGLSHVGD